MKRQETVRKILGAAIAAGATVSIAFLGLVGMYAFSHAFVVCLTTLVLAAAFEHQVNNEGIGAALKRLFDKNHLALGIVERFLNELITQQEQSATAISNNVFFQDYKAQVEYTEQLEAYIDQQEKLKKSHLFFEEEWKKYNTEIKRKRKELAKAIERLREMQFFFLKRLDKSTNQYQTQLEWDAAELFADQRTALKKEIRAKLVGIRVAGFFSIGVGACSGFATLGAIQSGIATFTVLGFIPFGGVVALSILAGIGYGLLMFQGVSDMIQQYEQHGKGFFSKREGESKSHFFFRCFFGVTAIVLALGATIATAATWWSFVKDGGKLVGLIDKAADVMQAITMSMMIAPYFLFNSHNSVNSIETIFKSNYKSLFIKTWAKVRDCARAENVIQFINPFRAIEKLLSGIAKTFLFLGHIASIGVSSDRVELDKIIPGGPIIHPALAGSVGASVEGLSDWGYLPDEASHEKTHDHHGGHEHKHESPLLTALYFPVALTVALLKVFSASWDYLLSSSPSFQHSFKKMFTDEVPKNERIKEPRAPVLKVWPQQEMAEISDSTTKKMLSKKLPNEGMKGTYVSMMKNPQPHLLKETVTPFSTYPADHRNSFWQKASALPVKPFEGKAQTLTKTF